MNHFNRINQTEIQNLQQTREFHIWIVPFGDWGKVNDSHVVADRLIASLPKNHMLNGINYKIFTNKSLTEVNEQDVDTEIGKIHEMDDWNCVNMVLGIGVAEKKGSVRFEYVTDSLKGGNKQFRNNVKLDNPTTAMSIAATAGWRNDGEITNIVAKHNYLPSIHLSSDDIDELGISTDPGDYLCEYMTFGFANSIRIKNKAFFVHVGDFRGSPAYEPQRLQEINTLKSFILEVMPLLVKRQRL